MLFTATDYTQGLGFKKFTGKPAVKKRPMGRQPGMVHLKAIDGIEGFIKDFGLEEMLIENPFLKDVKLYENPYMKATLARANDKKLSLELSSRALNGKVAVLRDIFLRAMCHFIAIKMFKHSGKGEPFKLLVERYKGKKQPVKSEFGTELLAVKH